MIIPNSEIILKAFNTYINSLRNIKKPHLISFNFSLQSFDTLVITDDLNEKFDDIFLFRVPGNKRTVIGLNSALELATKKDTHFFPISEKIKYWKKNFLINSEEINFAFAEIICCTVKFDPEKSSELWNDFQPLRIYIPEFLISVNGKKSIAYFNFVNLNGENILSYSDKLKWYLKIFNQINYRENNEAEIRTISTSVSARKEITNWQNIFKKASEFLINGNVKKLVLSRVHSFAVEKPICWSTLLSKLFNRFTDCYLFFVKRNKSVFFGSPPEMFLKVNNGLAEVESVAGSAPRGKKFETDYQLEIGLQSSEKNQQEHFFVSDFISEILIKYSDNVRIIEEKQIRKLDNIQHLITRISAELNGKIHLFKLIDSLFPTPAVCGVPKKKAINLIRKLETYDRGLYSGLIGLMDLNGNCELAVTIRSALVKDNIVNAFAGAGIIKTSNSEEEFAETELKLNTVLSLFDNESKRKQK